MTLLNVLERQLSAPANYRSGISALLTTKLLQDMVEVAAEDGHVGLVGANGGGSDMPYSFRPRLSGREDRAGAWHSRGGYRINLKTRSVAPSSRMVAVTVPWAVL
jgi:hypothetical protein